MIITKIVDMGQQLHQRLRDQQHPLDLLHQGHRLRHRPERLAVPTPGEPRGRYIPHLLTPVVTDMKEAANALRWCVAEMERRYRLMAAMGVRGLPRVGPMCGCQR